MAFSVSTLANPAVFLRVTRPLVPITGVGAVALLLVGTLLAFYFSPAEHKQGESVRIMYVHVPAATLSMGVYAFMAMSSFVGFVWRHRVADILAREAAPFGAALAFLTLLTGSLWGKATWGVYWDWDPRLTSMLVLFFLYLGYIAVWRAFENEAQAARLAALLAMIGAINLPIIRFSVYWWDSLHQKASLIREGGPSMDGRMLRALLVMMAGYACLTGFYVLLRTRRQLLAKQRRGGEARPASTAVMEPAK